MDERARAAQHPPSTLVVVYSYHHHNTEKVATAMARVLDAPVRTPLQVQPAELQGYDLVGLGSGIYFHRLHPGLLALADKLVPVTGGRAFLFSTMGLPLAGALMRAYARHCHAPLRERLQSRGYTVLDEFTCIGHDTNGLLRFCGGLNQGRPSAGDLHRAEQFARALRRKADAHANALDLTGLRDL